MKIEAGKFYKTRDGRKVGPVLQAPNSELFGLQPGPRKQWYPDGKLMMREERHGDLVEEWPRDSLEQVEAEMDAEIAAEKAGPVRTVTRKEIVPGGYYGVVVGEREAGHPNEVWVSFSACWHNAKQLRRAAGVLHDLANALEPSK